MKTFVLLLMLLLAVSSSGQNWQPIPGVLNGPVSCLAPDPSGNYLYVGGRFDTADGKQVNKIARWNGTQWDSMQAGGVNGAVNAMTFYNQQLYIGGTFTHSGNKVRNYLTRWTGTDWDSISFTTGNCKVECIAVYNGKLIVGGGFHTAGGKVVNNIDAFDGMQWDSLGVGTSDVVYALAVHNNELFAAGQFTMAGGHTVNRIAKWDGNSWNAVGSGFDKDVYALASYNGKLYTGGIFSQADIIEKTNRPFLKIEASQKLLFLCYSACTLPHTRLCSHKQMNMTPTQAAKQALSLRQEPVLFQSQELATSYADRCIKSHLIVLGDNGYWVCCFADAAQLEKAGYEIA